MTKLEIQRQVSENIREIRSKRGWSLRELARRSEQDASVVCHIESGKRLPTLESLVRLARVLRVSPMTLLKGVE